MLKPRKNDRIGVFGGTFDPIHNGHLIIADAVREEAGLDRVIFIPAACPPHKHHVLHFSAEERYSLISTAIADYPAFSVSDIEMRRSGVSYTIDTIRALKKELPDDAELFFIVGRDNLYEMDMWREPRALVEECTILVADRICDSTRDVPEWLKSRTKLVRVPLVELSSSDIRDRLRTGRSIRFRVPESVERVIESLAARSSDTSSER